MQLKTIDDPRDSLAKARRWELEQYAKANGVTEIQPGMPAIVMRNILRSRGLTRIPVPARPLGQQNQPKPRLMYKNGILQQPQPPLPRPEPQSKGVEANADDDLARQFGLERITSEEKAKLFPDKLVADMKITELRQECKRRGIKMARTDNMPALREKLNG